MSTLSLSPLRIKVEYILLSLLLMAGSLLMSEWMKPSKLWADVLGEPNYELIVPKAFADWVELPNAGRVVVDPVQAENLARIYTETLSRTYVHKPTGRMIMLSIAYGRNQSSDTQLHTPEQCYPSQGFTVQDQSDQTVSTRFGDLKSVRMKTRMGERTEPLTFFVRVGDKVVRGSKERNLARLSMGVKGYVVDGMLLRVSEMSRDVDRSYALQNQFIQNLLDSVSAQGRRALIGEAQGG